MAAASPHLRREAAGASAQRPCPASPHRCSCRCRSTERPNRSRGQRPRPALHSRRLRVQRPRSRLPARRGDDRCWQRRMRPRCRRCSRLRSRSNPESPRRWDRLATIHRPATSPRSQHPSRRSTEQRVIGTSTSSRPCSPRNDGSTDMCRAWGHAAHTCARADLDMLREKRSTDGVQPRKRFSHARARGLDRCARLPLRQITQRKRRLRSRSSRDGSSRAGRTTIIVARCAC